MRLLYIEPFHGGSHAAFGETLIAGLRAGEHEVETLLCPDRHWKWRMRGAAAHLALVEAQRLQQPYDLLFASSFLPLAELRGLVPSLAAVPALLYFHENQLCYPIQEGRESERDLHYGVTQMVAALAAQVCVFNSQHNREGFLGAGEQVLRRMPDCPWTGWRERVAARSRVLPLPMDLPELPTRAPRDPGAVPLLLWNHRWEHDKAPEQFLAGLRALRAADLDFALLLLGAVSRQEHPARRQLVAEFSGQILQDGPVDSRQKYWQLLQRADLAVSTARHEFFGLAMLEACWAGVWPLVPDALAYPEHFPAACRYPVGGFERALVDAVAGLQPGREDPRADLRGLAARYRAATVLPAYLDLLAGMANQSVE